MSHPPPAGRDVRYGEFVASGSSLPTLSGPEFSGIPGLICRADSVLVQDIGDTSLKTSETMGSAADA